MRKSGVRAATRSLSHPFCFCLEAPSARSKETIGRLGPSAVTTHGRLMSGQRAARLLILTTHVSENARKSYMCRGSGALIMGAIRMIPRAASNALASESNFVR